MNGAHANHIRYLYWLKEPDFRRASDLLTQAGYQLTSTRLTACQVLNASGKTVVYAPPEVWSRICVRQGSWYRDSKRLGQYMLMSDHRLPGPLDPFLDAEMSASDFVPERLPSRKQLQALVESEAYQKAKPKKWESIGKKDSILFKIFFTFTRFWGRGDNLNKHWLGHKANHANFLAREFTTEMDGETVPHSVTDNAAICSSCVEFFNIIEDDSRKLVRACPGAITFGGAERDVFYDVKPIRPTEIKP